MQEFNEIKSYLRKQKEGSTQPQTHIAGICLLINPNDKWIIDSGATHHICSNLALFETHKKYDHAQNTITVADGKKSTVEHIGSVNLENGITLVNVLHVPGFKFNLISTHQLCKDLNCTITFTQNKCILQNLSQKSSLVLGELKSGLYAVDEGTNHNSRADLVAATGVATQSSEESKLWHLRLGHLPFKKLHHVCNINNYNKTIDFICQICPQARQTRLPFPKSLFKSKKCFELLHIDVWGPLQGQDP